MALSWEYIVHVPTNCCHQLTNLLKQGLGTGNILSMYELHEEVLGWVLLLLFNLEETSHAYCGTNGKVVKLGKDLE